MTTDRIWLAILFSLTICGCSGPLPLTGTPTGAEGLQLAWNDSKSGALPFYVIGGTGVTDVALDPKSRTLAWRGGDQAFQVSLKVKTGDEGAVPVLEVSPLLGQTAQRAWVVVGSPAPVAKPLEDGDLTFRPAFYRGNGVVGAAGLKASEHLPAEQRKGARIEAHSGADLLVQQDGTFHLVYRDVPEAWEQATGLAYPGALVFPMDAP